MSVKWEKLEGNKGVLTFEVSAEEFDKGLDQAFKEVVKDVQLPGFRKGRVPRNIFENRFGVETLYQDAIDFVLPEAYTTAVMESGIDPIDQPEIDISGDVAKGQPVTFTATVLVTPEVELGEYKGLEIEDQSVEVEEEEVESSLEALREQHAELVLKEEGQVEEGDTVVIDFEGFTDGVAFDGGKGESHSLEIGSDQFIPGFEEQLIGKELGEKTEIEVTFPEEYHEESLSGKDATFKVEIHEIKFKELPELDDEFAKDVDEEVDTLDELKDKVRDDLKAQKEQENENQKRETLINKVTENATVDVPEVMVETELEQMFREFEQRLQQQGMTLELYMQFSGQDEAALKEQMKEDAEMRVLTNLTLTAIADAEGLEVTEEEVTEELDKMGEMYGVDAEQIKMMLGGTTEMIENDLELRKAIEFLLDESKVV